MTAVAALLAAAEHRDDTGEHDDAEDLAEQLVNDLVHLEHDSLAVWDGDGGLVGWATAIAQRTFRDVFDVRLEGRVHPDRRDQGVGRALLAWQVQPGEQVHAQRHPEAPGQLTVAAPTTVRSLENLLRRARFEPVRSFVVMERTLSDLPSAPSVDGMTVVPFDRGRDDEVRRAHNLAFGEHYGSTQRDAHSWRIRFTGQRAFRPELSRLGVVNDRVVGYALVYVHDSDTRATGVRQAYFGQIGVLPDARGRGLATALIAAALHAAAEQGCATAGLDVDGDNRTGALRLYEGLGFRRRRTQVRWVRRLPPAAG